MTLATLQADGPDLLGSWIDRTRRRRDLRTRLTEVAASAAVPDGTRFAFYGRISTEDYQDKLSSARWQRDFAEDLIAGRGRIVADFFDAGVSRRLPWHRRPQAAALLAALADPDRGFDAVVVGEYERAFYGDQLLTLAPIFQRHRVQVWLPELDGPVDFDNPTHHALLMLLGVHAKREVLRARYRVLAAMRAQVQHQGRVVGGRPPYGYRLVDAGPHPNKAHARWGRRRHRLEPDPVTAPTVRWMFALRLTGHSVAGIARLLNERGLPCPSQVDAARNPHRNGASWTLRTVATILGNPRYTGRQVWNRQATDHDLSDQPDDPLGRTDARRWNPPHGWVISHQLTHPPLVSERDFIAAQTVRAAPTPAHGPARSFLLSGHLLCQLCGRHLDAHWVHGRPAYRCRHGHTSTRPPEQQRPKNLYVREDQAVVFLTTHIPALHHLHPEAWESASLLTSYLLEHDLVIICGRHRWTLHINDHVAAEAPPPRMARAPNQPRPRLKQRTPS